MSRLERLDERYRAHHTDEKQEFVFGGDERGAIFAELVGGPGRLGRAQRCVWVDGLGGRRGPVRRPPAPHAPPL